MFVAVPRRLSNVTDHVTTRFPGFNSPKTTKPAGWRALGDAWRASMTLDTRALYKGSQASVLNDCNM